MRRGYYSDFWMRGGVLTSQLWGDRDAEAAALEGCATVVHPAEALPLEAWLRLSDAERAEVVQAYTMPRLRRAELVAA